MISILDFSKTLLHSDFAHKYFLPIPLNKPKKWIEKKIARIKEHLIDEETRIVKAEERRQTIFDATPEGKEAIAQKAEDDEKKKKEEEEAKKKVGFVCCCCFMYAYIYIVSVYLLTLFIIVPLTKQTQQNRRKKKKQKKQQKKKPRKMPKKKKKRSRRKKEEKSCSGSGGGGGSSSSSTGSRRRRRMGRRRRRLRRRWRLPGRLLEFVPSMVDGTLVYKGTDGWYTRTQDLHKKIYLCFSNCYIRR